MTCDRVITLRDDRNRTIEYPWPSDWPVPVWINKNGRIWRLFMIDGKLVSTAAEA